MRHGYNLGSQGCTRAREQRLFYTVLDIAAQQRTAIGPLHPQHTGPIVALGEGFTGARMQNFKAHATPKTVRKLL